MKRMIVSGLAVALGLSAAAHGQEVEWRTVGSPKPVKKAAPAQPTPEVKPTVTPVNAVVGNRGPNDNAPLPVPVNGDPSAVTGTLEGANAPTPIGVDMDTPAPAPIPATTKTATPMHGMDLIPAPGSTKADAPTPTAPAPTKAAEPSSTPVHSPTPVPIAADPSMTSSTFVGPVCESPVSSILPQCECGGPSYVVDGNRFYVRAEALLWWSRGLGGPPLATTGAANTNGALGAPGVTTVLNFDDLNTQYRPGVRLGAGWWFDPCQTRGIDASIFWTPQQTASFTGSDAEFVRLFRPFFALNTNFAATGNRPAEFSELVFSRPQVRGQFNAELESEFWGADINYRRSVWNGCRGKADVFAGFRYLNLDETLTMTENIRPQVPVGFGRFTLPAGSRLDIQDQFATRNDFYGGQIGTNIELRRNRWVFDIRPVVALGVTHQQLTINGSQTVTPAAAAPPGNFVGGLLATPTNIGTYEKNPFTVVPEVTFNVGYQLTDRWKLTAGYNFLYWSNVIRPGDQIDRNIDVTKIPNFLFPGENVTPVAGNHPGVPFRQTDFWAQGVNLGAEYKW